MQPRYSRFVSLAKDPLNGLFEKTIDRTMTIPWSCMGNALFAVEKILERSTHFMQYDFHLRGIPLAYEIDKESLKDVVVTDQPCFHCNILSKFMIFRANKNDVLKGIVTSVISRQATVTLQNVCTVRVNLSQRTVEEGDTVTVKIINVSLSGGNYALKGEIVDILKKCSEPGQSNVEGATKTSAWKLPDSVKSFLNTSLDASMLPSSSTTPAEIRKKKVKLSDTDTDEESKNGTPKLTGTIVEKEFVEPEPVSKKKKKRKREEMELAQSFIDDSATDKCTALNATVSFAVDEEIEAKKKKKKKKHKRETL